MLRSTQVFFLLWLSLFLIIPTSAAPKKADLNHQFVEASYEGDLEKMKALVAKGANVNALAEDGTTALMQATSAPYMGGGDLETVRWLLRAGTNVNFRAKGGANALDYAALSGWDDIMRVLISKGARVNDTASDGVTALMCAAGGGMTELGIEIPSPSTVELLLSKGAHVNAIASDGSTALIEAAKCKGGPQEGLEATIETVRLLLATGANPNTRTKNGNTALKWAKLRHNREVIRLLEHAGAKEHCYSVTYLCRQTNCVNSNPTFG